jgi:uncharacterized membrane protein
MKKIILYTFFVFIFLVILLYVSILFKFHPFSKTAHAPTKTDTAQTIKKEEVFIQKTIKGGGNEPGWAFTLSSQKDGLYKLDTTLDYGDFSYEGMLSKGALFTEDKQDYRGDVKNIKTGESKNVILFLERKNCTDDAGMERAGRVELSLNGEKIYKGCADL